jgi:hypothetical protein
LRALLELAWENRLHDLNLSGEVGRPDRRSDVPELPQHLLDLFDNPANKFVTANRAAFRAPVGAAVPASVGQVQWEHLIYAYMVENTRIYEIFQEVLRRLLSGEDLGVPTVDSQVWLRNTEELFFTDPAPFFITNVRSAIRPDLEATRFNAYFRMFGMELNHIKDYKYIKPEASNTGFVTVFEEFCRAVWEGIQNASNQSGPNPTDDAAISNLAEQLHDMLMARRQYGNLSREEFFVVAMMSWFHLTIEANHPIIVDLRADSFSVEQRLFKIGEKVNKPAHKLSKSFFELADAMSRILIQIETATYNNVAAVPALYTAGQSPEDDMRTIITHWSTTTGKNLRERKLEVTVAT